MCENNEKNYEKTGTIVEEEVLDDNPWTDIKSFGHNDYWKEDKSFFENSFADFSFGEYPLIPSWHNWDFMTEKREKQSKFFSPLFDGINKGLEMILNFIVLMYRCLYIMIKGGKIRIKEEVELSIMLNMIFIGFTPFTMVLNYIAFGDVVTLSSTVLIISTVSALCLNFFYLFLFIMLNSRFKVTGKDIDKTYDVVTTFESSKRGKKRLEKMWKKQEKRVEENDERMIYLKTKSKSWTLKIMQLLLVLGAGILTYYKYYEIAILLSGIVLGMMILYKVILSIFNRFE